MKKSFIRILILVMAISMIVPSFTLAETGASEGLISVSAPAPYNAVKRTGSISNSLIKWTLDGKTLTVYGSGRIPANAFSSKGALGSDSTSVETIKIQGTITAIGVGAFSGCTNLKTLTLESKSLKTIRHSSFYRCSKLKSVSIPKNVTHVQENAFNGNTRITCVNTNMKRYPSGNKQNGSYGYRVQDMLVLTVMRDYDKVKEMLLLINKLRSSADSLKMDSSLMEAAMERASEYVILQSHTRPNGEDCQTIHGDVKEEVSGFCSPVIVGNAVDNVKTATEMLKTMRGNSSNDKVLKDKSYNTIGIGCVQYGGVCYWVICLGSKTPKPKTNCSIPPIDKNGRQAPAKQEVKQPIETCLGTNTIIIYNKGSNYSFTKRTLDYKLDSGNIRIAKGDSKIVNLVLPRGGKLGNVAFYRASTKWSSSKSSVASVSYSGKITGKAAGVATVSAGSTLTKRASISVVVCDTGRLAGQNRIGTANTIATQYMKDTKQPKLANIIVVFSDNFPDALSASYLSSKYKAPIILTNPNVQKDVVTWIRKNVKAKGNVYFVGGTFVVPNSLKTSLASYGYKVTRVAGNDRYGTNKAVLQNVGIPKGSEIVVCDGGKFQNALIASATGKPMLLVSGSKLTNEQISLLNSQKVKDKNVKFVIVGNTSSVSASIATALSKYGKVERLSKSNPDAMSVAVAKRFWKNGSSKVFFATANNFPDALAGGPECIINKAPIFLITDKNYTETRNYCKNINNKVTKVTTFGGPFAVSDSTMTKAAGF